MSSMTNDTARCPGYGDGLCSTCERKAQMQRDDPAAVFWRMSPAIERGRCVYHMPACWCSTCRPVTLTDMRMVLCPTCGNKRCPKAADHRNACTGRNEPGQPGSNY